MCMCWPHAPGTGLAGTPSCLTPPPPRQCERGDPPLRKVPIFSRGMKSFLIPAQNRSLREPAREGAFGQGPSSLMGPAAGAGCSARPWGGSWAGLFSWPCPRDLAGHHQPRTPLTRPASHLSSAAPKQCCAEPPGPWPSPSGMNKSCGPAHLPWLGAGAPWLPTAPQLPTLGPGTMQGPEAKGMSLCNLPGCVGLGGRGGCTVQQHQEPPPNP